MTNKKSLTKARKQALTVLSFVIYGYLIIVFFSILDIIISKVLNSEILYFYFNWIVVVLWLLFSLLVIYHGLTYPSAFDTISKSRKYQNSPLSDHAKLKNKNAILDCIENDKPYFNSQITLNDFSKQCHITPKYLSQVLNEEFGMSFFDFINSHRIEFVKLQFQNNTNSRIIDVAYESGFNSKAAFNRAFKKIQGCTPTEYLKNLK